ncbi:MAG: VOC family protein [Pseudomonadota bacterium]
MNIGTGDLDRAVTFYTAVFAPMGIALKFHERDMRWAGWMSGEDWPLFIVGEPENGDAHAPGNGQMVAFEAATRATVTACHHAALAHGGVCEGAPGLRPQYHPAFFGAYFRDPDGNKICICCHAADAD